MKLGLRRALMAVALVGSAALALWGDREAVGAAEVSPRVAQLAAVRVSSASAPAPAGESANLLPLSRQAADLTPVKDRAQLIGREPGDDRSDLFHAVVPPPPAVAKAEPPPAPTAPALPFAYIGKQHDGAQWQLFLKRDNGEALVVREGDAIDTDYRLGELTATHASIVYLPLQHTHVLPLD